VIVPSVDFRAGPLVLQEINDASQCPVVLVLVIEAQDKPILVREIYANLGALVGQREARGVTRFARRKNGIAARGNRRRFAGDLARAARDRFKD
jgi:hypothetical protein